MSLVINNLYVSYGQHKVIENLELNAHQGELIGILGLNGSGKSTLFRAILGLQPARYTALTWKGIPIKPTDIAFLETDNFFYEYMKGSEYLQLIGAAPLEIEELNQLFELDLNSYAANYSSGMRKKLAFMRVLLQKRPILILDEPFNGLDLDGTQTMTQILLRILPQKCILMSSHIFSTFTKLANRILHLNDGHFKATYVQTDFARLEEELAEQFKQKIDNLVPNIKL